ncbi:MAG: DUF4102 domain-containing protein [Phycisphaera sp. TMED24]|nr:MAG: DUF4102 domain-containing protein [Phycisphaera sp. TMED24]
MPPIEDTKVPSVDRITVKNVKTWLANPLIVQTDYSERRTPGFHLRVNPKGTGTFGISYRFEGKKCRFKIARVGDLDLAKARLEAERIRGMLALGEDPQAQRLWSAPEKVVHLLS